MRAYSHNTVVTVPPFSRQPDGDEVVIANRAMDSYLAVPPIAVEVLDSLAEGRTVGEVKEIYFRKYGQELDIDDFLNLMESKRFVFAPNPVNETAESFPAATSISAPRIRYHFSWIPQPVAALIYSRPMLAFDALVILGALTTMFVHPRLVPHVADLVFPEQRAISFLLFASVAMAGVFLHELSHVVAARALGVNSHLAIGHRLWFLVAEADITGIWAMPKKQRYLPILAGMLTDAVSSSTVTLLLFARDQHWVTLSVFTSRILRALVLSYWLRISWQFYVFVRTDVYFALSTLLGCKNLLRDTEDYLWSLVSHLMPRRKPADQKHIPVAEMRIIRWYSVLWLLGRIFAFYILLSVTLPVAVGYIRNLSNAFSAGFAANPYNVIDSTVFAIAFLIPFSLGLFLWIRGLVRNERG